LTREASLGQTATLPSQGLGPVRRHARGGPVRLPTWPRNRPADRTWTSPASSP